MKHVPNSYESNKNQRDKALEVLAHAKQLEAARLKKPVNTLIQNANNGQRNNTDSNAG